MILRQLLAAFADNLLPILLIGGAAYLLGRLLQVEPRPVGRLIFYLFSPALVFKLLIHTELPLSRIAQAALFALIMATLTGLLAWGAGRLLGLERPALAALLLTVIFANAGNYGLPLVSFAFGQEALAFASVYFVATSILFNTIGVLIASLGRLAWKQAALGLLRLPILYAVLLALALNGAALRLPLAVERALDLAAAAAIPLMLALLGLELQRARPASNLRALGLIAGLRLIVSPVLALFLAGLAGLEGAARQAILTESAMPTAVTTTVLAGEFELDSSLVSSAILWTTLLSPLTLTPLLVFLGS